MREIRDSVVSAFHWSALEGPIAEEQMRGMVFRITKTVLHADAIHRGGGQIIPTARKVFYGSLLRGSPSLAEPVFEVKIVCFSFAVDSVLSAFQKRGVTCEIQKQNKQSRGIVLVGCGPCLRLSGIFQELDSIYGVGEVQIVDILWSDVTNRERGSIEFEELVKELRTRKGLNPNLKKPEDFVIQAEDSFVSIKPAKRG